MPASLTWELLVYWLTKICQLTLNLQDSLPIEKRSSLMKYYTWLNVFPFYLPLHSTACRIKKVHSLLICDLLTMKHILGVFGSRVSSSPMGFESKTIFVCLLLVFWNGILVYTEWLLALPQYHCHPWVSTQEWKLGRKRIKKKTKNKELFSNRQ